MTITPDTNILVRAAIRDNLQQAEAASAILRDSDLLVITLPCLCEFVWVLRQGYKLDPADIVVAIQSLLESANVVADLAAIAAGLDFLRAGGDFADGVIAYQGRWLGGATFASFDKRAVAILAAQGHQTKLLTI